MMFCRRRGDGVSYRARRSSPRLPAHAKRTHRDEHEDGEDDVRAGAPAGVHHLERGVDGGTLALDLHRQHGEEEHLDGGAGGVPEGAGDAVVEGDVARLKQRGGPRPLGHDVAGSEAHLDGAAGGGVLLAGHGVAAVAVAQVHQPGGEEGEDAAQAADDEPAEAQGERVVALEEGALGGGGGNGRERERRRREGRVGAARAGGRLGGWGRLRFRTLQLYLVMPKTLMKAPPPAFQLERRERRGVRRGGEEIWGRALHASRGPGAHHRCVDTL